MTISRQSKCGIEQVALLFFAVVKLVCLLVAIAYYTLAERKIMAAFQRRVGPNVVGFNGLLQPLADGLKLAGKEFVVPSYSNSRIFTAAAMATLLLALTAWTAIPFNLFDYSGRLSNLAVARLLTRVSFYPGQVIISSAFW